MMIIDIDSNSGFCFGVVRAVRIAEEELSSGNSLFCLGEIVHNQSEVDRLKQLGLKIIDHTQFKELKNERVLIRAHGEPPSTYVVAKQNNLKLIDASCKVVLSLQQKVKKSYDEISSKNGQIVIFGKSDHPEVIGLVGQINQDAIIINDIKSLDLVNFDRPIRLFAQTTKSVHDFEQLIKEIKSRLKNTVNTDFKVVESICKQVSRRESHMIEFANDHELIIFVGGFKSSNAKFLFEVCSSENRNTKFISHYSEIDFSWLKGINRIGITGATSTPNWLLDEVKQKIESYVS